MAWALVTPSSRGIGLALTQRLLQTTPASLAIVATARSGDTASVREQILSPLSSSLSDDSAARLDVQQCDLLDEQSIANLAAYCKERYQTKKSQDGGAGKLAPYLRLGLFVPGMLVPERSPAQIKYDSALETLKLNLLAPMLLVKHFSPFLPRKTTSVSSDDISGVNPSAAILAVMSARVGSISDNNLGGWYSYRASKAGVNQLVKTLDNHLKVQSGNKAMAVGLHPGTVKTGLSKEFWSSTPKEKLFEPKFAAERLCGVLEALEVDQGGEVLGLEGRGGSAVSLDRC